MLVQRIIQFCSNYAVSLLFLIIFLGQSAALYVVEKSECAAQCTSASSGRTTNASDASCYDENYDSTPTGVTFRNCVSCELESDAYDPQSGQEDVGWALCKS